MRVVLGGHRYLSSRCSIIAGSHGKAEFSVVRNRQSVFPHASHQPWSECPFLWVMTCSCYCYALGFTHSKKPIAVSHCLNLQFPSVN